MIDLPEGYFTRRGEGLVRLFELAPVIKPTFSSKLGEANTKDYPSGRPVAAFPKGVSEDLIREVAHHDRVARSAELIETRKDARLNLRRMFTP